MDILLIIPRRRALLSFVGLALVASAAAAGDIKVGGDLFEQECAECHSLKPGKNKKGPTMFGVFGRKAATAPDFRYSQPLQESGVTWDAASLQTYLTKPKKLVPGGWMKYDGLADAKAREDLIAFLETLH